MNRPGPLAGWGTALRVARRQARRAKGRSALVVALIALPVLGLSFAAVSYDSFRLTPEQELTRELGTADASLWWRMDGPLQQSADGRGYSADNQVSMRETPATESELRAVLPAGSRLVGLATSAAVVRTATGVGTLGFDAADLTDPIHQGRIALRDGRAPATHSEVALTPRAADRLAVSIGDLVETADHDRTWQVVGIVEYQHRFGETAVVAPGGLPGQQPVPTEWLLATPAPVTWQEVQRLNEYGIVVRSRAVVLDPPPPDELDEFWQGFGDDDGQPVLGIGLLVGGLAMLEVVLLAGPAFAVGARQRQRELALVAANGGHPGQLRRLVLADGVVLGTVGAIVGIGLGTAAALAGLPLLEQYLLNRPAGGYRVFPVALLGIAGLAVVAGLAAALVPAITAARQPVVAALAGHRGIVRSRRRWPVIGAGVAVAGSLAALAGAWLVDARVLVAGLVLSQLGLVLATPALVGLVARMGRFLPLAPRIALRDTARNRAAAAPAISAVMAAVAGGLTIGMYLTADQARSAEMYAPGLPIGTAYVPYDGPSPGSELSDLAGHHEQVVATLRNRLDASQVVAVWQPACPAGADHPAHCDLTIPIPEPNRCPFAEIGTVSDPAQRQAAEADWRCNQQWIAPRFMTVVDDGTALPALTRASADDLAAAARVLRAGGVVTSDPRLLVDDSIAVEAINFGDQAGVDHEPASDTVPGHLLTTGELVGTTYVSPQLLERLGLEPRLTAAVAATTEVPDVADQDAVTGALHELDPALGLQVERGGWGKPAPVSLVLAAVAGVIALGAAVIATGLAAAERHRDLATLAATGATPRLRRLLSLSHAGVIAGLGAALGTVAGLVAGLAVVFALNQQQADVWPAGPAYPLQVPWLFLALVLLVVPAVAMLTTGLLTRSRLPIERRLT